MNDLPEELGPYVCPDRVCEYQCRRRAKADRLIFAEMFDDGPLFYWAHRGCAEGDPTTVVFTIKQALKVLRAMRSTGYFHWPKAARDYFFGLGGLNLDDLRNVKSGTKVAQ